MYSTDTNIQSYVFFFSYTIFPPQKLAMNKHLRNFTLQSGKPILFTIFPERIVPKLVWIGKVLPGLIVWKAIEANISFHRFLNLGHNSRITTKTTKTYVMNFKHRANIFPEDPHSENTSIKLSKKVSEIIWKDLWQNVYRQSGIKYMNTSKHGKDKKNTCNPGILENNGGVVRLKMI